MQARLGGYSLWQFRDYIMERGLPVLLLGALLAWVMNPTLSRGTLSDSPGAARMLTVMLVPLLGTYGLLGTLISTNGMVSNDRRLGYFRFLFSKPVHISAFYAQAFVVHWAGFVLVSAAFLGLVSLLLDAPVPVAALGYLAGFYIAFGGILFLASVLVRFDWLVAVALWSAGTVLHALSGQGVGWAGWLEPLVPPSHAANDVAAALLLGESLPGGTAARLLGYGAVCFVLGVAAVRYRPLST